MIKIYNRLKITSTDSQTNNEDGELEIEILRPNVEQKLIELEIDVLCSDEEQKSKFI